MFAAARDGADGPPADLRFLTRPKNEVQGECATAKVVSFLQTIYESVAENLPDVKDDAGMETDFQGIVFPTDDPYTNVKMKVAKGVKTRRFKQGLKLHVERRPENSGLETRYLPPGCMQDFFEQFKNLEGPQAASFSTFWRVWRLEFEHLKFRPVSSHSQCSVCLHHRVLLRELAPYLLARQHQAKLYHEHLAAQYRDRLVYWSLRGSSRLKTLGHICIIQDGMDQCKFAFPRSNLCRSKDLSTMNRPKLGIVGIVAHGFALSFTVSGPEHPKDSSCMAEIFCAMLTRLERLGVNLSQVVIHLIADNTSRETKNSTTLRLLSALVQQRTLAKKTWYIFFCQQKLSSVLLLLFLG